VVKFMIWADDICNIWVGQMVQRGLPTGPTGSKLDIRRGNPSNQT